MANIGKRQVGAERVVEKMVKSLVEFCDSERLEGAKAKRKIGF